MNRNRFRVAILLCLAVLVLSFTGCSESSKNKDILELTQTVTAEDIDQLENYPNLQKANLRGSECYTEILAYASTHPEVQVEYDVVIGSQRFDWDTTHLEFTGDQVSFSELSEKIAFLPNVTDLFLPETAFSVSELEALRTGYPNISVDYTIEIAGTVYSPDSVTADFSQISSENLDSCVERLSYLPLVEEVLLSESLTPADVKLLQSQYPGVFFDYQFDLFGKIVSTRDERIEYDEILIGNEGETMIREALDILTQCSYIKFDDCGIDSTVMERIRDDYPDVKVVWRIHIGKYSLLTDETMMRLTFVLKDDNVSELKYCTDIVYLDVGHNDYLSDLSFISYMPNLECAIVSGSSIKDLSVFSNCSKLVWLEMCYCGFINDLSPIQNLKELKYLNISFTSVPDYTPLDETNLERFVCMGTKATKAEKERFAEIHPDCMSTLYGAQPFGYGWRYNDYGYNFFEYYVHMREVFRYDDKDFQGNMKE